MTEHTPLLSENDTSLTPSESPVLTVSQLTQAIKMSLEHTFLNICLQGEISNLKTQASGHLYFSLKDAHAQISAVMFRGSAQHLKIQPKSGDQVLVKGEINVYPSKGNYQIIIRELSYVGLGELLQKLEQLKIKLHQMGWFKAAHKKPIPKFPKRIGVVTSPTGAVIQDILNILTRRFSGFHLILNPVKVQGEGAAQEIARAIKEFNLYQMVDVMIVGRGGGSIEDLWAFNEEIVAEAIYNSHIPIICAVGHETDHCIADYVADLRAPTPSAAAEIVIAEKTQQLHHLETIRRRLQQTVTHLIDKNRHRLDRVIKHPSVARPFTMIDLRSQRLDDCRIELSLGMKRLLALKHQLLEARIRQTSALKPTARLFYFRQQVAHCETAIYQHVRRQLGDYRQKLIAYQQQLDQIIFYKIRQKSQQFSEERLIKNLREKIERQLERNHHKLNTLSNMLKAIDPKNVLSKGYSILFSEKDRSVINSIHKLKKQEKVRVWLIDGEALVTINEIIPREQ